MLHINFELILIKIGFFMNCTHQSHAHNYYYLNRFSRISINTFEVVKCDINQQIMTIDKVKSENWSALSFVEERNHVGVKRIDNQ